MSNDSKLILVSENHSVRETIDALLAAEGLGSCIAFHRLREMDAKLGPKDAALVLVDLDPQPMSILSELEPIIDHNPMSRFVVLTGQRTPQLILRAMQAGARHVQLKSEIRTELGLVIRMLHGSLAHAASGHGILVSVLSAGGGCGATTLCVNMANDLLGRMGGPVLLVDGDLAYGAAGTYLGLERAYGLADILTRENPPDALLMQSSVERFAAGFDLLLAPGGVPARPSDMKASHFEPLIEICRHTYPMTVLDLPRPSREFLMPAIQASAQVMIVMQPTVKDFRVAYALVRLMGECGIPYNRLMLAVNRYDRRHSPVPLKEIQKAFGELTIALVRNDYASAIHAATEGVPVLHCLPRSVLAADIANLAQQCLDRSNAAKGELVDAYE